MIIQPMKTPLHGVTPLGHLGVIRAQGDDAAAFLHGQLTQDFALLGLSEARLAAFCSAKGRMQASMIGFKRSASELLLVCPLDLLPATLKRLSMFVMRAKARLSDASADFSLYGLCGSALGAAASGAPVPWSKQDVEGATVVRLYPADATPRALWVGPASAAPPLGAPLDPQLWAWSEVRSGIASISQPLFEALVPQMLNYESVGGVSFKKGCYPGQEVVARSQFRGTLKRRAFLARSAGSMRAGQEIFKAADPDQACGLVAQAAAVPPGLGDGFEAIVSIQLSAADAGPLHLGSASGPTLTLSPPPYPLLADI